MANQATYIQIKLLVLVKNNLELSISWSNFDLYFQMHATGQTRRTQSTTDTTAVVHFLWHRWASMLKMSVSYNQILRKTSHVQQMDILTDLRQMFEINRRLKCEKNNPSPQYCNDHCSKSWYALCVNISRRPTYTEPYALFCNSRTAVLLIDIYYICCE